MVGGISLKKAIEIVGHENGTNTKTLIRALRKVGVRVPHGRLTRFNYKRGLPRRCVMRVWLEQPGRMWSHWILRWDGKFYDPSAVGWIYLLNRNPRLTSYLELR
jgi:hypothetical protein